MEKEKEKMEELVVEPSSETSKAGADQIEKTDEKEKEKEKTVELVVEPSSETSKAGGVEIEKTDEKEKEKTGELVVGAFK